jgi:thymidylate synthase
MQQYRDLVSKTLASGSYRTDRTGTGAYSIFGDQMEFNLAHGFPLITGKKMFTRGIFEELDWILAGSTNNQDLVDKNVHIWDEWAKVDKVEVNPPCNRIADIYFALAAAGKKFEKVEGYEEGVPTDEMRALTHEQIAEHCVENNLPADYGRFKPGPTNGALGPIYGKQWRDWSGDLMISHDYGSTWEFLTEAQQAELDRDGLYLGEEVMIKPASVDQIQTVIDLLKNDPFSRRICVSAWNPGQQHRMRLAPCHAFFQFFVERIDEAELRSEFTREQWLAYLVFLTEIDLPDDPMKALSVRAQKVDAYFKAHGICNLRLSCKLTQRSADLMIGIPFNVPSYSALLLMMAHCMEMRVGRFIWSGGDIHIYANHLEGTHEYMARPTHPLCRAVIDNPSRVFSELRAARDIKITDYVSEGKIDFPVAV